MGVAPVAVFEDELVLLLNPEQRESNLLEHLVFGIGRIVPIFLRRRLA
jgi:hypothetical protein